MTIVNLGIIEVPLILIAVAGIAFAVFVDSKIKKPVYAKDWDDELNQHLTK